MRPSFLSESAIESFAGTLNIRTKLLLCLAASVSSIILSNPQALGTLAVASAVYALTALSPAALLRTYMFVAAMLLLSLSFTALISLFVPGLITWEVGRFAVPYLRMAVSLNALFALAYSSRIQDVMRELKAFGRFRWIHLPLTVAIRFVPTFIDDCSQIMAAWRLRSPLEIGGGGKGGSRGNRGNWAALRRAGALWRAFLVPLTFRLLRSADELAVAAELKGVGSGAPARIRASSFARADYGVLLVAFHCLMLAFALQKYFGPVRMMG